MKHKKADGVLEEKRPETKAPAFRFGEDSIHGSMHVDQHDQQVLPCLA
ncbi:hypothetical protein NDK47_21430 [Brevibacillus ruminantium]|uniref:Uncharacterized protein n=1 Tax=Brevibacillus ruminantium TaxID=2950604 RepID=A0ABY4WD45_9BACL|nr:hypothetical protein [Brevibacillus ruminantium]USG64679.1 hypothetical protein NDK47_21430 [Brevibacillus ruminantium]